MRKCRRTLSAALIIAFLIVGALAAGLQNANAEENGVDQKPVLGWSSWSFIREQPTAAKLEAQAQAMQNSGLQKLGYEYINLDDFWYHCPGPQGPNVDCLRSLDYRRVQISLRGRYQRHQGTRKPHPQPRDEVRNLCHARSFQAGRREEDTD